MKKDGRSLSHEALETCRFAAIKLHKANVHVDVIADSMGVTRQAVYRWIRNCKSHGAKALKSSKATGTEMLLSEEQINELKKFLRKPATKLGYPTDLWSGPRVRHLIGEQFEIKYHRKHMPRLMKSLGLVLKFPERRAIEQDPAAVRRWKKERLPEIIKAASKQRALLFYADESLISLIPYIGKTWTFPGKEPIVRVSGRRGQHIGVTAAVNQQGRMCFELTKEDETFTAKVFIRFLKKMRVEFPRRFITIIVDGASVHKAKTVQEFQHESRSWLRLEILPAYSPELNPTEKSWRFLKTKKLSASVAKDKNELREGTKKALREIRKDKDRVASFFKKL
jgi:transposase